MCYCHLFYSIFIIVLTGLDMRGCRRKYFLPDTLRYLILSLITGLDCLCHNIILINGLKVWNFFYFQNPNMEYLQQSVYGHICIPPVLLDQQSVHYICLCSFRYLLHVLFQKPLYHLQFNIIIFLFRIDCA